ncbi:hypothetical protein BG011_009402 [Mortierella polycephala]|uniref:Fucosyltransferase n=1 Tax=Mortierella polycephala TaxID=41804 RepID=A0A9P6PNF7_9FUNG|nr:hypothetical protein BG011_009402 [Mortierella polycephala]
MRELLKLMDIDIYGGCLGNTAWPVHTDTQKPWTPVEIMADYKFVFVLEEVNCLDYVSNDFADALIVGVVPVVDGPKDYSRFSPTSNALVHLDAFIVPELLVQELDAMDRNDTLYSERLSYRVPSGNDKSRLSPVFRELFDKTPSKITETTTTTTTTTTTKTATTPDRHGALCGICQLARDVAENEYDWAAHKIEAEAWAREVATSAECEPQPRYLPGLPVQMNAYEEHLERQTKGENEVKSEENVLPPPSISNPSHAVHVAVSFDNSQSDPLTVVSLPPLPLTDSADSWDPSKGLLQSQSPSPSPFLSEMYYLLFLILVLLVGVVALAMITSRNARKVITWPGRHMFYSKIPDDDCEAMSLERMMLSELGEDLIYA